MRECWINVYLGGFGLRFPSPEEAEVWAAFGKRRRLYRLHVVLKGSD